MSSNDLTQTNAAEKPIRQARYSGLTDNRPRYFDGAWSDWAEFYSAHPCTDVKGGALHNFAELRSGTTRANHNVIRVHAFVADIDHRDKSKVFRSRDLLKVAGIAALFSSTWSYRPEAPRLRVAIQLSWPVLRDEWPTLWDAVNARFELHADTKSRDAAHLFYDPSAPHGAPTFFRSLSGKPLDVDAVLRDAPPIQHAPAKTGLEWYEAIERIPDGARDSTLTSLAGKLFRSELPPELSFSILRAVNVARCKPPLSDAQVSKIAKSIASKEARGGGR